MALPKYTDPAVQNRTQDTATDHVDDIQHKIDNPGKEKNSNSNSANKKKGYKEGNRDDSITENADNKTKHPSYGKRL